MAIGGVILTIAVDCSLRIDGGYVRAEDESAAEPVRPDRDDTAQDGVEANDGATDEAEGGGTITPFRPAPAMEPEDKALPCQQPCLPSWRRIGRQGCKLPSRGSPNLRCG